MSRKRKKKYFRKIKLKYLSDLVRKDQFEVIVVATMSAGKSTIINSLIGMELLPASNQACTSRVFKIENIDGMQDYKATIVGADKTISTWIDANPESLKNLSALEVKGSILIHGDMKNITNTELSLAIYDTPGPNNSQDVTHSNITREILNDGNYGLILYVLNATQFGVDDDAKLLNDLFDFVGNDLDKKDVLFILNKADQLDEGLGEDLDTVVTNVNEYLEHHGFQKPVIIPLSSISALLARKIKKNEPLTSKEKRTYHDLLDHYDEVKNPLYEHGTIAEAVKSQLINNKNESTEMDKLIEYSGITAIEYFLHQKLRVVKKEVRIDS